MYLYPPPPSFVTLIPSFLPLFQAQAGWLQHDFGHLSVFKSRTLNHIAHHFLIGHLKVCGRRFLGSMVELFQVCGRSFLQYVVYFLFRYVVEAFQVCGRGFLGVWQRGFMPPTKLWVGIQICTSQYVRTYVPKSCVCNYTYTPRWILRCCKFYMSYGTLSVYLDIHVVCSYSLTASHNIIQTTSLIK